MPAATHLRQSSHVAPVYARPRPHGRQHVPVVEADLDAVPRGLALQRYGVHCHLARRTNGGSHTAECMRPTTGDQRKCKIAAATVMAGVAAGGAAAAAMLVATASILPSPSQRDIISDIMSGLKKAPQGSMPSP